MDERTLRFTLPVGFASGKYDVWVINPLGQENVLPGGLLLGDLVYLSLTVDVYTND